MLAASQRTIIIRRNGILISAVEERREDTYSQSMYQVIKRKVVINEVDKDEVGVQVQ